MKIKDLIKLKKRDSLGGWDNEDNETKRKYFKKNGYLWYIPSHSSNGGVLLNKYEKDCVVAYVENKYFIAFLIKINKNNYRGFCYLKDFLRSIAGSYSYSINDMGNDKGMMEFFEREEENLIITEQEEYSRFKKLLVLEAIGV